MNKKNLSIFVVIVLALAGGVFVYRDMRGTKGPQETTTATTTTTTIGGVQMTGDGKVTIVPVSPKKLPPAPSLVRSTDFKNTLTPEIKTIVVARINVNVEALKKDPKNLENWIMLGVNRKTIGDYEGARDAWEYVKALNPNDVVAWNNLGDLYHFYLKDYKKSEENWKRTIMLNPKYVQGYRGLVELYTYSMKEKLGEIPALLKEGISKNPDAVDLQVFLARYYKDRGDVALAKKAYGDAIVSAERLNNTTLVATLKADLAMVK